MHLKRANDIVLASLALIVSSPLFVLIVLLIKLESWLCEDGHGTIFKPEIRISQGKPFHFYKFRVIKQKVLDEEKVIRRRDRFKTLEKDQYCTFFGCLIKKFYLDELPQLFNILRGDMSWVGPRPFPEDDYQDDLKRGRLRKKLVLAGLTGPTQINKGLNPGKSDVELDNEYVNAHRTLSPLQLLVLDWSIIFKTFRILWRAEGL